MFAGVGHGHVAPDSASGRHVRTLGIALVVLPAFLVLEVVVGLATGSLALLSDAGHMFIDVLGVGMAPAAITAARRASAADRNTFGPYRAEVLAAPANAVLLFGVAAWVLVEAVQRFSGPARRRPRHAALHRAGRSAGSPHGLLRTQLVTARGAYMITTTPSRQRPAPRRS